MIRHTLPRDSYNKWTEIDLSALAQNLATLQQACPSSQIMGVVKANAYGHNVSLIAPALWQAGVRYFGVATLAEAHYLRELCPQAEMILLLGALPTQQYKYVIEAGFDFILHSSEDIALISGLASSQRPARLHLKLDTGMGRVGMQLAELPSALDALLNEPNLHLEGVCSHLSTSDIPNGEHLALQIERFEQARQCFQSHALARRCQPLFHLANSDAILASPASHYDLVRPGIALYGYSGLPAQCLRPVLSLKSQISQIKEVPADWSIGYGRSFITRRPSRLGVIPVGYADGVNRRLSNRAEALIAGQRVPLVGRISMDQSILDLTDFALKVEPGSEVTLIGRSADQVITAQDWADRLDTIPYEVLTSLGTRLPRYHA